MTAMKLEVGGCSAIDENLSIETHLWIGDGDTEIVETEHLTDMLLGFADGFLVGYEKEISAEDKTMLLDMAAKLVLVAQDFQQCVHELGTVVPKKKGKKK
jgi:hypothetical protein